MRIKDRVEIILRDYPATRSSDRELKKQIGRTFYGLTESQLEILDILPDSETIRRNRQTIQNTEGKYKADKIVKVFREVRRADMEAELGYHPTQAIGQRMHEQQAAEAKQAKMFEIKPQWD